MSTSKKMKQEPLVWAQMNRNQKILQVVMIVISLITFGMIFPNSF